MIELIDNPERLRALADASTPQCLGFTWDHRQYYLPGEPILALCAFCFSDGQRFECAITDDYTAFYEIVERHKATADARTAFTQAIDSLDINALDLTGALSLETVTVAKPWGREIWYTGIEARGICRVEGTPLPWLISMAPWLIAGDCDPDPVLLKILDPLPDDVYGDLYFELHEEKIEVYVVTHIDERAWPEGIGWIRYGFDRERLAEYPSSEAFREAYLDAVREYRRIRTRIDEQLDRYRASEGYSADAAVPPATLKAWMSRLNPELCAQEREYRDRMNAFTAMHPLEVGDVVQVEPLTPHALQHGVRVIEFQTPHYERHILSFAQKVLTQAHWDTEAAMARATLASDIEADLTTLSEGKDHRVDIIADFDAFQARRAVLAPGASISLPAVTTCALVIGVSGIHKLGQRTLTAEQACYVPAVAGPLKLTNEGDDTGIALIALPAAK